MKNLPLQGYSQTLQAPGFHFWVCMPMPGCGACKHACSGFCLAMGLTWALLALQPPCTYIDEFSQPMFYIPGVYNASVLLTAGMEFASVQMAFLHTMDRWMEFLLDWTLHGNLLESGEHDTPYVSHSQWECALTSWNASGFGGWPSGYTRKIGITWGF